MSDYDNSGQSTNIGSLLTSKIGADTYNGTLRVFGHEVFLGRDLAVIVNGAINTAKSKITQLGGLYARQYGTQLATMLKAPSHNAAQVGNAAEMLWRYGVPLADVALGVKSAVSDGYKRMDTLKDESAVLLAANNDMKVGVSGVLGTKFRALANERALIFKEGKKTVLSSFASVISNLPNIIINVWQQKKEMIEDPERVFATLSSNASMQEKANANAEYKRLVELQTPAAPTEADAKTKDPLMGSIQRFLKPKTLDDLTQNLDSKTAQVAPAISAALGQMIGNRLQKDVGKEVNAWRRIKELEGIIQEQEPGSGREIENTVREIFQQHVMDCGSKQKLAGNKFAYVVQEISEALVRDKLHPQALAEILDNAKIFSFDKKGVKYGRPAATKEELAKLLEKYNAKVSKKEFYKDAPFTEKDVVATFASLTPDERPFFTMLFPPGTLEAVKGIDKAQVERYRHEGRKCFVGELTETVSNIIKAGREELQKRGVKGELIDDLEAMEEEFTAAMERGTGEEYIAQNLTATTEMVRNMGIAAKDKKGFWQDYVRRGEESRGEPAADRIASGKRSAKDFATRPDNDEISRGE